MTVKKFVILAASLALLSACTEKVDVQLGDTEPKVVIEAYLATETDSSYVKLSRSINYFASGGSPAITDATVEITGNGNTILFNHIADGLYKGPSGYMPDTAVTYTLKVLADGQEYTSVSTLYPMFYVDPQLQFEYRDASGFLDAGYAVTYWSSDSRPQEIHTQFKFGQNDTLFDQEIIFSNTDIVKNELRPFELPFYRPLSGDSVMLEFRSIDPQVAAYLVALANLNSGAPGPFQTPPANPPTNISGGAIGYFMATDVKRLGERIP